tara:strand:+ start:1627 stop:2253 length:627 start_codon:yes stop_codon:yes gene_type:complete
MSWVLKNLPDELTCKIKSYMFYPWDIRNNLNNKSWKRIHNRLAWIRDWDAISEDEWDEEDLVKECKDAHLWITGSWHDENIWNLTIFDASISLGLISSVYPNEEDRKFLTRRENVIADAPIKDSHLIADGIISSRYVIVLSDLFNSGNWIRVRASDCETLMVSGAPWGPPVMFRGYPLCESRERWGDDTDSTTSSTLHPDVLDFFDYG